MLDPVIAAGMIFSLILIALIGGFITLFPITRRLGAFLEKKLEERTASAADLEELEKLRETVRLLRREVESISERQDFMERLVEGPEAGRSGGSLGSGDDGG